jgi:hypothetical protein
VSSRLKNKITFYRAAVVGLGGRRTILYSITRPNSQLESKTRLFAAAASCCCTSQKKKRWWQVVQLTYTQHNQRTKLKYICQTTGREEKKRTGCCIHLYREILSQFPMTCVLHNHRNFHVRISISTVWMSN